MRLGLSLGLFFATLAFADSPFHASLRFTNTPSGAWPAAIVADPAGNFFIASNTTNAKGDTEVHIDKVDPEGSLLGSSDIPTGAGPLLFFFVNYVGGMAVDPAGNLVVAVANTVIKLDSQLRTVLFSKNVGNGQLSKVINALALDSHGNIYVTGATWTPQGAQGALVTEISPDGTAILSSTLFGDSTVHCAVPDDCVSSAFTTGTAIAVDTGGNVTIAGLTDANHLPMTTGAFSQTCGNCGISDLGYEMDAGFIAKFSAGATKLLAATYIPVDPGLLSVQVTSLILDSSANVLVAGSLWTADSSSGGDDSGFVMKFDGATLQRVFATRFGGVASKYVNESDGVSALAVDSQGFIWITGASPQDQIPVPPDTPVLGEAYLAALAPDGSLTGTLFTAAEQVAGVSLTLAANGVTALGSGGALLTASPGAAPSLVGISNSAGGAISNAVAPLELVSLYGLDIGPSAPQSAQLVGGAVSNALDNVQVLFDGVPAPLLYAGPTQIEAVVPSTVAGQSTTEIQVITPSVRIDGPTMQVEPSQPGVALSANQVSGIGIPPFAAALNEDGTVNSPSNPAQLGSVVAVWVSGAGLSTFHVPDGTIRSATQAGAPTLPVAAFQVPVGVIIDFGVPPGPLSIEVTYAGDAAGMVAGSTQVNFRVPPTINGWLASVPPGALVFGVQLQVGDASSESFSIYVTPPQ